jgi:hypothetical protein
VAATPAATRRLPPVTGGFCGLSEGTDFPKLRRLRFFF